MYVIHVLLNIKLERGMKVLLAQLPSISTEQAFAFSLYFSLFHYRLSFPSFAECKMNGSLHAWTKRRGTQPLVFPLTQFQTSERHTQHRMMTSMVGQALKGSINACKIAVYCRWCGETHSIAYAMGITYIVEQTYRTWMGDGLVAWWMEDVWMLIVPCISQLRVRVCGVSSLETVAIPCMMMCTGEGWEQRIARSQQTLERQCSNCLWLCHWLLVCNVLVFTGSILVFDINRVLRGPMEIRHRVTCSTQASNCNTHTHTHIHTNSATPD